MRFLCSWVEFEEFGQEGFWGHFHQQKGCLGAIEAWGLHVEFSDGQVSVMTHTHFKKGTAGKITIEMDMTLVRIDWSRFGD